jgi:hypothetical protein
VNRLNVPPGQDSSFRTGRELRYLPGEVWIIVILNSFLQEDWPRFIANERSNHRGIFGRQVSERSGDES